MFLKRKSRVKPFYKQLVELRENVQNRKKFLGFEKKKWEKFIENYTRKLKWYKKFKPKDQFRYLVSRYPSKRLSYKSRTRNSLHTLKMFKLFYGGLRKAYVKTLIKIALKWKYKRANSFFLELFERRLDIVLYRSKFCLSVRHARQLILHGKIFVNGKPVKIKSYNLDSGDLITINQKDFELIQMNIQQSQKWPIPPKHLIINYSTLQIMFGVLEYTNFSFSFFYYLNLERILNSYYTR